MPDTAENTVLLLRMFISLSTEDRLEVLKFVQEKAKMDSNVIPIFTKLETIT